MRNTRAVSNFNKAARIVSEDREEGGCFWEGYCCIALENVCKTDKEIEFFNTAFDAPNREDIGCHGWWGNPNQPKNQVARTIALLLCAEMIKE